MALSARLELRQSQSLVMTPQLMQSIKMLQLSHLELNDFVDAELLRNPLLEREEGGEGGDAERGGEFRDGHASILADEIEEFRMTGMHRIRSFRQRKLPLRQAKGVFSGSDQAFSLRNFSMNSARATAPSYGIAL